METSGPEPDLKSDAKLHHFVCRPTSEENTGWPSMTLQDSKTICYEALLGYMSFSEPSLRLDRMKQVSGLTPQHLIPGAEGRIHAL